MGLVKQAGRLAATALTPVKGAIIAGLRSAENYTPTTWYGPRVTYTGGPAWEDVAQVLGYDVRTVTPAGMWKSQPNLRTVVDFLARNTAQLGLHVYERMPDGGRRRAGDTPLAQLLDWVDGDMTTYDLVYATVGDVSLYDVAYWWIMRDQDSPADWSWVRLPPNWVTPHPEHSTPFRVNAYLVTIGSEVHTVKAASPTSDGGIVRVGGYDPSAYVGMSSAVEALRDTLQEQIESTTYRKQVWKRGGRVSAVLERPVDAEPWSDAAREAFREDWYAKYTGNGSKAGGTPILEDGMKLTRIDFTAQEQQYVESSRLTLQTVAGAYHVNPTMIGQTEGASYSNVREFHRMLYSDTLGPLLRKFTQRMNKHILPILGMDPRRYYVEFNIQEKLSGSFEEQAAVMSTSTGRPWLTVNEARARQNLPAIEGGDELIIPMNVTVGGQASPRDTGSQNEVPGTPDRATSAPPGALQLKAPRRTARDEATEAVAEVLAAFWKRQGAALRSKKAGPDWDTERWDKELTEDLLVVSRDVSLEAALDALKANGEDPNKYNLARTMAYLREASYRTASTVNQSTKEALAEALEAAGDDPELDPYRQVFQDHAEGRAKVWGASLAGFVVGFGVTEAARQAGGSRAVKTWRTNSGNPRSSHALMDGETVPVSEPFSNGMDWPGSFGDPAEVAGCMCSTDVSW